LVCGAHTPLQTPATHALLLQVAADCQVPVLSQACGTCPLHCFAIGVHVPEQAPPLHKMVHVVPGTHAPSSLHVSGARPLQRLVLGMQLPWQAPPTHAWFAQMMPVLHCPLSLQVSAPPSVQRPAPGAQIPLQAPSTQAFCAQASTRLTSLESELHFMTDCASQKVYPGS
jgi:hypothetical protein